MRGTDGAAAGGAARAGFRELFTSEPTGAVREIFALTLRGRFTIRRWTGPRLAARLARIETFARRALARTRDEQARAALGDVVVTASERDAPTLMG